LEDFSIIEAADNVKKARENIDLLFKEKYPDFISLDELRRVCKIGPSSARYLVENGIIPAIDTGKQTWRYKISIDDVIVYLRRRKKVGTMIPPGAVTSRSGNTNRARQLRKRLSFSRIVDLGQEWEVAEYFNYIYADCDDILTTMDIAEMTGLDKSTVLKALQKGYIRSIEQKPQYLVPKQYLMEFVVSQRYIESHTRTERFLKILGGFELWKKAKSSR
jgi:hypothetical protein